VSRLVYNLCMGAGLLLIFAGAWLQLGLGIALLGTGLIVWLSTLMAASLATKVAARRAG
jgi:hypothetical protein